MSKGNKKVFNADEVAMFCDQMAMLLNGGVPLYEGTFMLYSEMEDGRTREVLQIIDDRVKDNIPLYKALEETEAFPDYMVHMVNVGEQTGELEKVLRSLAVYYERESRVKAGIKSAVAYPVILFTVMAGIMVILSWKILPLFERMFEELSSDVSVATKNAMSVGLTAGHVIAVAAIAVLVIVVLLILWSRTKTGREKLRKAVTKFGPTKKLSQLMAVGKFISAISLVLSSGMNVQEGLEQEEKNCTDEQIRRKIKKCIDLYNDNEPIDEAVRKSGIIVGMESRLISVAAKTGEADVIFAKLSDQYNEKISAALSKLTTVIETALVIVLSVLVGAVLLAVMLPLVSMISSIG